MSAKAMARLRAEAETVGPMRYCENVYGADLRILLDAHAALETAHTEALDARYARGVADERARVVAWLRGSADELGDEMYLADRIERGEHEEAP